MSYILDALRKSEHERRNQDSTTPFTGGMLAGPAQENSSLNPWVWIALSVIVSANVFGGLYLFKDQLFGNNENTHQSLSTNLPNSQSQQVPSNTVSSPVSASVQNVPTQAARVEPQNTEQLPVRHAQIPQKYQVATSESNQAVRPVAHRSKTVQPAVIGNRTANQGAVNHSNLDVGNIQFDYAEADIIRPKSAANVVAERTIAETAVAKRTIQAEFEQYQATEKDPKYDVVNFSTKADQQTLDLRSKLLEGIEAPEVISPASTKVSPSQVTDYTQQQAERLPKIKELSLAQQSNVPPIHFSGHLYSSRSESRSIRLGQNKYGEGDWITDALQLTAVTEDGVVFDLQGTRFYMSSFDDWNGLE